MLPGFASHYYLAVEKLKLMISGVELAIKLNLSPSAVSRSAICGRMDSLAKQNFTCVPYFRFQGKCLPGDSTFIIYGLAAYSEAGLEKALKALTKNGSPS
jgi:hypothetical protein